MENNQVEEQHLEPESNFILIKSEYYKDENPSEPVTDIGVAESETNNHFTVAKDNLKKEEYSSFPAAEIKFEDSDKMKEEVSDCHEFVDCHINIKKEEEPFYQCPSMFEMSNNGNGIDMEEHVEDAISAFSGNVKIETAAENCDVSKDHNEGKSKCTLQQKSVLSEYEEKLLAGWILDASARGFYIKRADILLSVQEILKKDDKMNLSSNLPGRPWYKAFLNRHPILKPLLSKMCDYASISANENSIRKWFLEIESTLKSKNVFDLLADQSRIFKADITAFTLDPKTQHIDICVRKDLGCMGCINVMFTFGANGSRFPPLIVYNYRTLPKAFAESIPDSLYVDCSDTGRLKSENIYKFIKNVFYPQLVMKNIKFPVFLFMDSCKISTTFQLNKLCSRLHIILISLRPNFTNPIRSDAGLKPIKKVSYLSKQEHHSKPITEDSFALMLDIVIKQHITPDILMNIFRACGLFPWGSDNIHFRAGSRDRGNGNSQIEKDIDNDNSRKSASNNLTISYKEFSDVVGNEYIDKFRNITDIVTKENNSQEFCILHTLYEIFNRKINELKLSERCMLSETQKRKIGSQPNVLAEEQAVASKRKKDSE